MGGGTDSAGVPWEGRRFHDTAASDDDGAADARLVEAIRRFRAHDLGLVDVISALRAARLLVPLVAVRGDEGVGVHGQLVDTTQELSIVTVAGPDGRAVLPVFTSVETMRRWDPVARPIPVAAPRVALAAASEGTALIVLDPGAETELGIRRPAFPAVATGERWTPASADETVLDAFLAAAADEPAVLAIQLAPGDPEARLSGPDVLVQLSLVAGLDEPALRSLLERLQRSWASDAVIAERVDSIGVRLERVG